MGSARRQRRNNGSIQNRDKLYFAHPASLVETEDIGAKTRIWAFAHVMRGAVVGADALVIDDVPPHSVVAGIPAKVIRSNVKAEAAG